MGRPRETWGTYNRESGGETRDMGNSQEGSNRSGNLSLACSPVCLGGMKGQEREPKGIRGLKAEKNVGK